MAVAGGSSGGRRDDEFLPMLRGLMTLFLKEGGNLEDRISQHMIQQFKEWAKTQASFIESSPTLQKLAKKIDECDERLKKGSLGRQVHKAGSSIKKVFSSTLKAGAATVSSRESERQHARRLIQDFEKAMLTVDGSLDEFSMQHELTTFEQFRAVFEHYEHGLLDERGLFSIFSNPRNGEHFFSDEILPHMVRFLDKMDPNVLFRLFDHSMRSGVRFCHHKAASAAVMPLFMKLSSNEIKSLLMYHKEGKRSVYDPDILEIFREPLMKLLPDDFLELFTFSGDPDLHPFQNPKCKEFLKEKLWVFREQDISRILFVLNRRLSQDFLVFLLYPVDAEKTRNILSCLFDRNRTLLHQDNICNMLAPIINELPKETFLHLMTLVDDEGNTPLHHSNLLLLKPSFDKLTQEERTRLMSQKNREGFYPAKHFFHAHESITQGRVLEYHADYGNPVHEEVRTFHLRYEEAKTKQAIDFFRTIDSELMLEILLQLQRTSTRIWKIETKYTLVNILFSLNDKDFVEFFRQTKLPLKEILTNRAVIDIFIEKLLNMDPEDCGALIFAPECSNNVSSRLWREILSNQGGYAEMITRLVSKFSPDFFVQGLVRVDPKSNETILQQFECEYFLQALLPLLDLNQTAQLLTSRFFGKFYYVLKYEGFNVIERLLDRFPFDQNQEIYVELFHKYGLETSFLAKMKRLNPELLLRRFEDDKTLLHNRGALEALFPFLLSLDPMNIFRILSQQDATGSTPLHLLNELPPKGLEALLKIPTENLVELLMIRNRSFQSCLHLPKLFIGLKDFLLTLDERPFQMLCLNTVSETPPPLANHPLEVVLEFVEKMRSEDLKKLAAMGTPDMLIEAWIQNAAYHRQLEALWPLLEKLDPRFVMQVLEDMNSKKTINLSHKDFIKTLLKTAKLIDLRSYIKTLDRVMLVDTNSLQRREVDEFVVDAIRSLPDAAKVDFMKKALEKYDLPTNIMRICFHDLPRSFALESLLDTYKSSYDERVVNERSLFFIELLAPLITTDEIVSIFEQLRGNRLFQMQMNRFTPIILRLNGADTSRILALFEDPLILVLNLSADSAVELLVKLERDQLLSILDRMISRDQKLSMTVISRLHVDARKEPLLKILFGANRGRAEGPEFSLIPAEAMIQHNRIIQDTLSREELNALFDQVDSDGIEVVFNGRFLEVFIDSLLEQSSERIATFLSKRQGSDDPLIFKLQEALMRRVVEQLEVEDLLKVLALRNRAGGHPHLAISIPKMNAFDRDQFMQLVEILIKTNSQTLISGPFLTQFLDRINLEDWIRLLSYRNERGETLLHNPRFTLEFLQFLAQKGINIETIIQFLSITNERGIPCFHIRAIQEQLFPLLISFYPGGAQRVVEVVDVNGNNVFHKNLAIDLLVEYLTGIGFDYQSITNYYGLRPLDRLEIDQGWLLSRKAVATYKPRSQDQALKDVFAQSAKMVATLDSINFGMGEGDVAPSYVFTEGEAFDKRAPNAAELIRDQKQRIRDVLIETFQTIGNGIARDGANAFYLEILTDIDDILTYIQSQSNQDKAGWIVQLASVRHQGRCTGGLKAEINQKAIIARSIMNPNLEASGLSNDEIIQILIGKNLLNILEAINRAHLNSNVHNMNQLLFAAGLSTTEDDHPTKIPIEEARNYVIAYVDINQLLQDSLQSIPDENIELFLNQRIPDAFDMTFPTPRGAKTYKSFAKELKDEEEKFLELAIARLSRLTKNENLKVFLDNYRDVELNALAAFLEDRSLDQALEKVIEQRRGTINPKMADKLKEIELGRLQGYRDVKNKSIGKLFGELKKLGVEEKDLEMAAKMFIEFQSMISVLGQDVFESYEEGIEAFHLSLDIGSQKYPSSAVMISRKVKYLEALTRKHQKVLRVFEMLGICSIKRAA